jgi:hypothetical protein
MYRLLTCCPSPVPLLLPLPFFPLTQFGFKQDSILMMTDDCPDPMRRPTRNNMFQAREGGTCASSMHQG